MKKHQLNKVKYYARFRDMIDGIVIGNEEKPAISWFTRSGQEKIVTLGKLREDVLCLQEKMIELGLAGKHIAILGENSYEWLVVYFATTYCGAVAVCVDIEQSNQTIKQMLTMTDVDAIFASKCVEEICFEFAEENKNFFALYDSASLTSVYKLIEDGKKIIDSGAANKDIEKNIKPEDTAAIVFTSGTTNYSKPVMLSQEAILTNASDALANVSIGKVAFTSLPFYHTYGLTCSVLSMLIGEAHLYINGNMKTVMRDIQLASPHTMLTVPLMLETIHTKMWDAIEQNGKTKAFKKLLKIQKLLMLMGINKKNNHIVALREKCFGSIELIICGGAHVDRSIMEELYIMGVMVVQGYGITECAPLVSVNRNKMNKFDSVGLVSANSEVKIQNGEILVRGKNVMKGYYNLPELTEEAMEDGWFKTGDLGEIDKDGFLYITGRKKNLIVFKNGKKVSPEKLEEAIKKIPLVKDVVVYGAINGSSSDDVQVATTIFPNKEKTAGMNSYEILEALEIEINKINKEIPLYQQIQMINIREQEFSKTAINKIKRHLIV